MVLYCGISRNLPGNESWLPFTQEALLLDRMHSNRIVRFSDYETGLLTKDFNRNTTTKLINKQVGFWSGLSADVVGEFIK